MLQESRLLLPGGRCPFALALVHATGNGLTSFLGWGLGLQRVTHPSKSRAGRPTVLNSSSPAMCRAWTWSLEQSQGMSRMGNVCWEEG